MVSRRENWARTLEKIRKAKACNSSAYRKKRSLQLPS